MFRRSSIALGATVLGFLLSAEIASVEAGELFHRHKHEKSTQATPHTEHQAGHPHEVSEIAAISYNEHYSGGYVGGGKGGHGGHERCAQEGTWGWDYTPFRPMSSRIFLKYSHGGRYQGGTGSYATDGPKPIEHLTETIHGHFGGGD